MPCCAGSPDRSDRHGCSVWTATWRWPEPGSTGTSPARARAVLTPLLAAAERLAWVPALAGGALVDGRAAAALGDHAAAGALIGRAVMLAARHGMPTVERHARAGPTRLPREKPRATGALAARMRNRVADVLQLPRNGTPDACDVPRSPDRGPRKGGT